MLDGPTNLRKVDPRAAMVHALWEAHACIGQWAFCACLAMLRKAIDMWSAAYRDQHGMTFDKRAGERDSTYWRLRKIADENKLYRESIHAIINGLRLDANDAVHNPMVCAGGRAGTYEGSAIVMIRAPYERLHRIVVELISTTTPGFNPLYSDESRWRQKPPE